MPSKKVKIIKKFVRLLPFGLTLVLIVTLTSGIDPFHWELGLAYGFLITLCVVLLNPKAYNGIEELPLKDYLESHHTHRLPYEMDVWEKFQTLTELQFASYDVYTHNPNEIIVKVQSTILKMKHENDELIISVERSSFDFYPDHGRNYLMLQRVLRGLHTDF